MWQHVSWQGIGSATSRMCIARVSSKRIHKRRPLSCNGWQGLSLVCHHHHGNIRPQDNKPVPFCLLILGQAHLMMQQALCLAPDYSTNGFIISECPVAKGAGATCAMPAKSPAARSDKVLPSLLLLRLRTTISSSASSASASATLLSTRPAMEGGAGIITHVTAVIVLTTAAQELLAARKLSSSDQT